MAVQNVHIHNFGCKLCLKTYENTKVSRRNLTKNPVIISILNSIGVEFKEINLDDTICQKCYRNIEGIEEKDSIRTGWCNSCKRRKFEYTIDNDVSLLSTLV